MYERGERFLRRLPFFLKKCVTPFVWNPDLRFTLKADILVHGMDKGPNGWGTKKEHGCGGVG
jgi:hypothetical protein